MRIRSFVLFASVLIGFSALLLAACKAVDNWTLSGARTPAAAPVYELRLQGAEPLPAPPEFEPYQWDDPTTEGMEDK